MDGCIYRTKDGECDLYAKGGKYLAFCVLDMENCEGRKMSNADRIRRMTDEELATFLSEFGDCPCVGDKFCERGTRCEDGVLMWLKQEAADG
jgi:hypothetical protein